MITKTVDWLGAQLVVEYEVAEDTLHFISIKMLGAADLTTMLDRLLAGMPCDDHVFHVVPALAHLGELLEPSEKEALPNPTHAASRSLN